MKEPNDCERLKREIRANTYNPETGDLVVSATRAEAFQAVSAPYASLFGSDPDLRQLRKSYAIPAQTIKTPERQRMMNAFFFWAAWACGTERPGSHITYTQNWPPEPLIDNRPTSFIVVWSVLSVMVLLAGVGGMVWYFAAQRRKGDDEPVEVPERDPLLALQLTPSMRATLKYFWVVAALILAQVGLGAVTAHYGVEGDGFYGIPLSQWLPYSVARTWHTQLGIFWIATAWLATGLFVAPAVSGYEPRGQKLGINFLFVCLLLIVVGSLAGEWMGVQQKLGLAANFWFGHQGYEYVDLGRFWQIFLFVGLFLWLFLVGRSLWPAFRNPGPNRHLLALFVVASAAIGLIDVAQNTGLSLAKGCRIKPSFADSPGEPAIPAEGGSAEESPSGAMTGKRLKREWTTMRAMVRCYCQAHHEAGARLCGEFQALLDYATRRLARCRFGADKPTCARCPVHCYQRQWREQMKTVMRYAGPRMLWRHPILSLRHWLDGFREAPSGHTSL